MNHDLNECEFQVFCSGVHFVSKCNVNIPLRISRGWNSVVDTGITSLCLIQEPLLYGRTSSRYKPVMLSIFTNLGSCLFLLIF